MGERGDEQLTVLRLVASGAVAPEEALELLEAVGPEAGAPAAGPLLRVYCALEGRQADFTIPAEACGELLELLPAGAADRVPRRLLERLTTAVSAHGEDCLLRIEDNGLELTVTRAWGEKGWGRHVIFRSGQHQGFVHR